MSVSPGCSRVCWQKKVWTSERKRKEKKYKTYSFNSHDNFPFFDFLASLKQRQYYSGNESPFICV